MLYEVITLPDQCAARVGGLRTGQLDVRPAGECRMRREERPDAAERGEVGVLVEDHQMGVAGRHRDHVQPLAVRTPHAAAAVERRRVQADGVGSHP